MIVPLTPLDLGRRAFKLYPSRLAVVDGNYRATYSELASRIFQLTRKIRSLGLNPGDRVAVLSPNTHQMLETFYGVPWAGAVLVPLNTRLNLEDYRYILNHSGVRLFIVDHRLLDSVRPLLSQVEKIIVVNGAGTEYDDYDTWLQDTDGSPLPVPTVDENAMITLNYTSGTTARPKGAMLTHRNTYMNAIDVIIHLELRVGDRYLHTLPMFHVNGWGDVWAVSAVGGVHVCIPQVNGPDMWDQINREQVNVMCGAPTVLNMLLAAPHRPLDYSLRIAMAGAPPPATLIRQLQEENIRVIHVYGLTEVSPWITISEVFPEDQALGFEERAKKASYQGMEQILAGEVKVVRSDGTEVSNNGEELGDIVCRGNVVMAGYFNQPEETAKAIRDGWFYTGDLAVVHPNGYIQIRDRAKDVIISGGENISSIEVEDVLYRHPAVYEAAVIAVPDEKWGETPKAFIVTRPGQQVSPEELRTFCRDNLAHFKVPSSFEFVDALPRTASGKVQKYLLRQMLKN